MSTGTSNRHIDKIATYREPYRIGDRKAFGSKMTRERIAPAIFSIFILWASSAYARNYVQSLVGNLLAIGYPISKKDVIALDKTAMRFDEWNRIDVLKKILSDRKKIHSIPGADYYNKTGAICDALRLLDEHDLPETDALIEVLSRENGWETREKALLSYMAAKRGVDYQSNVAFLLSALPQYGGRTETGISGEISFEILDFCNNLSYLADIFNHTGDIAIGNALIHYAAQAYGYPGEYSSRLLVDMCLQQPEVFIPIVAAKDEHTRKLIIDAMVSGIWNNQQKENVLEVITQKLRPNNDQEKKTVTFLSEKIRLRFSDSSTNGKKSQIDTKSKK